MDVPHEFDILSGVNGSLCKFDCKWCWFCEYEFVKKDDVDGGDEEVEDENDEDVDDADGVTGWWEKLFELFWLMLINGLW